MFALSKDPYELPDHLKYGVVTVRLWLNAWHLMVTEVSFMPTEPYGTSGVSLNHAYSGRRHNVDPEDVRELFATTEVTVQDFLRRIYRYSLSSNYHMDTEDWTLVIAKKHSHDTTSYKIVAPDYLFVQLQATCMSDDSETLKLTILTQPSMLEDNCSRIEPGILQRGDTSYFNS